MNSHSERHHESSAKNRTSTELAKRVLDVTGAIALLVLCAPVFLGAALAVALTSGRPIFYLQERVGRYGRPFKIIKFRTMRPTAGATVTRSGDARITACGRILRRYKIDELPQLFNVLRGEMSFVGPRPELAKYVAAYPAEYRILHSIRPGITDEASIAFRNEEELLAQFEDTEAAYIEQVLPKKIALSLPYARHPTIRQDLSIIARTVLAILKKA